MSKKAPEGRHQLGLYTFFKPPSPPITEKQREKKQKAERKKFQEVLTQLSAEAAKRIERRAEAPSRTWVPLQANNSYSPCTRWTSG
eukprot:531148-Pelagomonas_calceolata.AAC.3